MYSKPHQKSKEVSDGGYWFSIDGKNNSKKMKNVIKSETYWFGTILLSNAKGNLFFIFLEKVHGMRNSYNVLRLELDLF